MTPKTLLKNLETLKCDKSLLSQSLTSAVKFTFVEKFSEGFDRPCSEDDFSTTKKARESHITCIRQIIENFADSSNQTNEKYTSFHSHLIADNKLLASLLVMVGENVALQPWNSEVTVQNCQFVLSAILKIFTCYDTSQLISKNHKANVVTEVLNLLSPNLLVSTWKYFPASVACYKWFLLMIKQPALSSYLHSFLPPALLLVDDFINENKVAGVKCLSHIVENVAAAELQYYGHGDVIYSALLPLMRMREANLLFVSIPLILQLTTKLDLLLRNQNESKWSRFDSILEILLENMELEQLVELRTCYISHLGFLIDNLKHRIVRWSRRLLRIFEEYIQTAAKFNDEKSMSSCIQAVEKYIKFSEQVIPLYDKKLLYVILVALIFTNNSFTEIQVENKKKLVQCVRIILKSMSKISYEEFKSALHENYKNKKYLKFYEQFISVVEGHSENLNFINEENITHGNS